MPNYFQEFTGHQLVTKVGNREELVDKITSAVEMKIFFLKKKQLNSSEIANIVLKELKQKQLSTFMRFLAFNKEISTSSDLYRQIKKYL